MILKNGMATLYSGIRQAAARLAREKRCSACAAPFSPSGVSSGQPGHFFCANCLPLIPQRTTGFCPFCGELAAWESLPVVACARCLQTPPAWDRLFFYGEHLGLLRNLLLRLKFSQKTYLAFPLAALLLHGYPCLFQNIDVISPIPLHTSRLRKRGYNQAYEIAKALYAIHRSQQAAGDILQGEYHAALAPSLLVRTVPSRPQTGLSRLQRLENMHGIFTVRQAVHKKRVLLVDDIMTTGATLASAAGALKKAGAASISVAVISRTPFYRRDD